MSLQRIGWTTGLVGGLAWVVKVTLIAAVNPNDGIQPIEGILFVLGLLGPIGAGIGSGALAAKSRSALQVLLGIGFAALFFVLTFAVLDPLEGPFRGQVRPRLVDEMPLLIVGAVWALISWVFVRGRSRFARLTA